MRKNKKKSKWRSQWPDHVNTSIIPSDGPQGNFRLHTTAFLSSLIFFRLFLVIAINESSFFFSRPSTDTERKKRQKENAVGFLPVPQVYPTTYANVRPKPRKKPGADAPAYLYWDDRLANSPLIRDSIEKTSHTHCKTHTHTHTQAVGCCCCCCCSLRMCNRPSVASVQRRCSTAI